MLQSTDKTRADFDTIAELSSEIDDNNGLYHDFLLKQIPSRLNRSLEIGCGMGAFTRKLAERSDAVVALDLSPRMIEIAKQRSKQHANIDYQTADILTFELESEKFDLIATIATLHHLPTEQMLMKLSQALRSGGVLIILDLCRAETVFDLLTGAIAFPVNVGLRLLRTGRLLPPRRLREAWNEHGKTDTYLTLTEVRTLCARLLPGAKVRKHLLWRYSIAWKKGLAV